MSSQATALSAAAYGIHAAGRLFTSFSKPRLENFCWMQGRLTESSVVIGIASQHGLHRTGLDAMQEPGDHMQMAIREGSNIQQCLQDLIVLSSTS